MSRPSLLALVAVLIAGCASPPPQQEMLRALPVADLEGVITRDGVSMDAEVTADGNGSLRVEADGPVSVRLYELGDLDVEDARIDYRARLRTENASGRVYLEMWCDFPGGGQYFSRALASPLTGTNEWTVQETPFFLQAGQNPQNVRLNLVLEGGGTAWIDDIRLTRTAL
jgi:hypothetical protein